MPTLSLQRPLDQPEGRSRLLDDLRTGLQSSEFQNLRIVVAYAKVAPLRKLQADLEAWKSTSKSIEVIFGIDQQGTSLEALRFSLDLFDTVWVFHQYGRSHTFHPKLYLFEGEQQCLAYVGSNNFTTGGTETNFECGIKLGLCLPQDQELVRDLGESWEEVRDRSRELDEELLAELEESRFIVSEREIRARTYTADRGEENESERPDFPQTHVQPASPTPGRAEEPETEITESPELTGPSERVEDEAAMAWRKRNLRARDAQRPGERTNPSGVITLVQDYYTDDTGQRIDKTTYFRHNVFGDLEWWEEEDKEVAETKFRVWIGDNYRGTFTLRISHKLEWEAGQDNYTTAIHWGPLNRVLRQEIDIRGWNFYLYETDEENQWEIQLVPPED